MKYLTVLLICLFCLNSFACGACQDYFNKLVDAIYLAEGGSKATYLYGIKSIPYKDEAEARQICYNSVRNNYARWLRAGKPKDFIEFMGDRYCPPTAHKLNKNWVKNVRYFYGKT